MQSELESPAPRVKQLVLSRRLLVLTCLFVVALGIRLYHFNDPPLNFHATRQYRSLIIARGFYFEHLAAIPGWEKQVANLNRQRQGILEPPVMEILAAGGYFVMGGEHYWIPKLLSTSFWLLGGLFLYWIARRITDASAALFAIAFYLFLPFAVVASRSFQPDPLMVMLLLASILAVLRYDEQPTRSRLAILIGLSAAAIFIKPVSLFAIFVVFALISFRRQGVKKSISTPSFYAFFMLSLLPTILFYLAYGLFLGGGLREQARSSFLPGLLLDPFFWKGWLDNIQSVIGLPALVGAFLGVMLFRKGLPRLVILGLWIGYVLFCLTFDYHIATHDYYHLQLIPIVALALGTVFATLLGRLLELNRDLFWRTGVWTVLLLALALSLASAWSRMADSTWRAEVGSAEQVGELVRHSTDTVFLASDYGLSLEYHGELSGQPWPLVSDLQWETLAGVPSPKAPERFDTWFAKDSPRYFIVMDLRELEQQQDLKAFLTQNYPILSQGDDFLVFDLQQKSNATWAR